MQKRAISGLHDDHGHLGFDRVLDLVRSRFYWPRMSAQVKQHLQNCLPCIRRKAPTTSKKAPLVSITTYQPMELVCLDYLSLEVSKGGYENVLVITDHFTRYAVAIPTRNQTAMTTARVLYDHFLIHYGFPARLHSDQGRNFESSIIRELCTLIGTRKCRTTPYHPQGNGTTERFNSTLLSMLGTLTIKQKADWKAFVPSLVHAYNSTRHDSTGFAPFYLMFGRHPRLPIDVALGIYPVDEAKSDSLPVFVENMKKRLRSAYDIATEHAKMAAKRYKKNYDAKVRESIVEVGDRVLVRKLGIKGKQKLCDRWEEVPYIVQKHPNKDIPVYVVQREDGVGKLRTLHRNLLLSLSTIPIGERSGKQAPVQANVPVKDVPGSDAASEVESDDDSIDESVQMVLNPNAALFVPEVQLNDMSYSMNGDGNDAMSSVGSVDVEENGLLGGGVPEVGVVGSIEAAVVNIMPEIPVAVVDTDLLDIANPAVEVVDFVEPVQVPVTPIPAPRRSRRVPKPVDRYTDPDFCTVKAKVQYLIEMNERFATENSFSKAIVDLIKTA